MCISMSNIGSKLHEKSLVRHSREGEIHRRGGPACPPREGQTHRPAPTDAESGTRLDSRLRGNDGISASQNSLTGCELESQYCQGG
jgi:hypothetical protein